MRRPGLFTLAVALLLSYLTTDWKSGEVRRLANWLSEEK